MQTKGTLYFWLDSVSWRKPGSLEVRIAQYIPIVGSSYQITAVPKVKDFFEPPPGSSPMLEGWEMSWRDGYYIRHWIFRSGVPIPKSPDDRTTGGGSNAHAEQWTIAANVMQVPIESHWNLKAIMKAGGGVFSDGQLKFPRYLGREKNRWYGVTDFLFPSITVSVELPPTRATLDFEMLKYVGTSNFPPPIDTGFQILSMSAYSGRKPWLLIDVAAIKKGDKLLERRSWRWGGLAGWADPIYDQNWGGGGGESSGVQNGTTGAR